MSRAHAESLKARHRVLDKRIAEEQKHPSIPAHELTAMKRERLALRDRIADLEAA